MPEVSGSSAEPIRPRGATIGPTFVLRLALAVAARPRLWRVALWSLSAYCAPRWWARPPFLPLPDRGYLGFRLVTVYGSSGRPAVGEVVEYLEWVRKTRRA